MSGWATAVSFWKKISPVAGPLIGVALGVGGTVTVQKESAPTPQAQVSMPSVNVTTTMDKDVLAVMSETNKLLRDVANKTVDPVVIQCKER